jgi:hypothetical protein
MGYATSNMWRLSVFLLANSLMLVPMPRTQSSPSGHMGDDSDWWSQLRMGGNGQTIHVEEREAGPSNFRILDVDLADNPFSKAAAKLGKAPIAERGDGAAGRSQVCYVSPQGSEKIHLVFENGEITDSFYLFAGGPDWKGSDLCVESSFVSKHLSVASGLRLGQTPAEVRGILGKPSEVIKNKLTYSFGIEKKSSAEDLDNQRRHHPELSEEDVRRNFESYYLSVYIEARFSQSSLVYLAISKGETY